MARSVTIRDVARAVGVHPSTVSRALDPDQRSRHKDVVVQRIMEAADRLGYRPDVAAASLRRGRSRLVGVIVPDIANPVFSPIIGGLEQALAQAGFALIVADLSPDRAAKPDVLDALIARRVDGLVLANVSLSDDSVGRCIARKIPVVLVNRMEESGRVSSVVSDDVEGMRLAVEHLVSLGHRRIVHVAGPQALSTGLLRYRGFLQAMAGHELQVSPAAIEEAKAFTLDAGVVAARALLKRQPDCTAVIAANDLLALGVYQVLHETGRACPQDVSVVGHNDMPLMDFVSPALTTIRISHREMGERAGRLLIDTIADPAKPPTRVITEPVLVTRGSTMPVPPTRAC